MSLIRVSDAVPDKDLVKISYDDAVTYQWGLIEDWRPIREVGVLRFGPTLLACIAGFVGVHTNNYYRLKLKCGRYGYVASYLPLVIMPALACAVGHRMFVTTEIIMGTNKCPICIEMRSIGIQTFFGVLYPYALAPATAYVVAQSFHTARFPNILTSRKEFFKSYMTMSKVLHQRLPYLIGVSVLASSIMTYIEFKQTSNLMQKIQAIEEKFKKQKENM